MFIQAVLKFLDRHPNLRTGIIIDARENVGSASLNGDAIGHSDTRHFEGDIQIGRAIVNSWQDMRMQIYH